MGEKAGINWRFDAAGNLRNSEENTHPVIYVSWNDAQAYCDWLSKKTGKNYRLPSEAEWEYAAGNGNKHSKYSWGDGLPSGTKGGNVADEKAANKLNWTKNESNIFVGYDDGYVYTAPVGKYAPNELGLYDMTGNVWEWCLDWYDKNYYSTSSSRNPVNNSVATTRVLRGGSWYSNPQGSRVAYRDYSTPDNRSGNFGFRVVFPSESK
jgi:formylglycine-generating enzyme required for sulfatase activity